ncbi:MAG: hypothetical protein ACRDZO_07370 [Egibacteraceae bacterium]
MLWVGVLLGSGLLAVAAAIAETPAGPVSTGVVGLGTLAVACGGFLAGRASRHSIETLIEGMRTEIRPQASPPLAVAGLSNELERSRRYGHSFTIVKVGARHAAVCGDASRHPRGLPSAAAHELRAQMRCVDKVWVQRDEVFVLMPECNRTQATRALQRIERSDPHLLRLDSVRLAAFPTDGLTIPALIGALERTTDYPAREPFERVVGER